MKKLIFVLTLVLGASAFAEVNIQSFHNKNFDPINSKFCGTHLEVSGSTISITNIIPPRQAAWAGGGCGKAKACKGQSYVVECEPNGNCYGISDQKRTQPLIKLLVDGNYLHDDGVDYYKNQRSESTEYFWCG